MRRRILFVIGLAVGYVLGARAGRSAYDSIVDRVNGVTGSDKLQQAGEQAKRVLEEKAPKVAAVAEQVVDTAAGAASSAKAAGNSADSDETTASEPSGSAS